MGLTGKQYAQLNNALRSAFTKSRLDQMLFTELEKRLDDISLAGNLQDIIYELISRAENEGWISQFIEAAYQTVPGNALLADFYTQYQAATSSSHWYKPQNCFYTCFIHGNRAFVNRKKLREILHDLDEEQCKVLVVNGPKASGISYSLQLISYIAKEKRSYKVVRIDLKQDALTDYTPRDLALSIARQMKLQLDGFPERDPHAQASKWVQELRDWIIGEVNCLEEPWWLVIDGFQQTVLPDETIDLIKYLVDWVDKTMPLLSIVLLGYSDMLTEEENSNIKREAISQIDDIDLKEFFEQLFTDKKIEVDPQAVDSAINKVNTRVRVPKGDPKHLPSLSKAVKEVSETLFT